MAVKDALVRRRRRDTNELDFKFEISRSRIFCFEMPDGVPFDDDDSEAIEDELLAMDPKPDELQMPVASGLGDLVCETFAVTFADDKREDWEIMMDITEAVRRGLRNRAWVVSAGQPQRSSRTIRQRRRL